MRHRIVLTPIWCAICMMSAVYTGCVAESKDAAKRDVAGPYQTWDEVINRWVGGQVSDLYVELGPPNLHPHQREDGTIEMIWDFAIDRMPDPFFRRFDGQGSQGRTCGLRVTGSLHSRLSLIKW
jgi:hypothetical protein